jgi:hypothetical protein
MNNKFHEPINAESEQFHLFAIPRLKAIRHRHYRKLTQYIKSVRDNEHRRIHLSGLNQFAVLYRRKLN